MRWHWARYRVIVHATEDEQRVREALMWAMRLGDDAKDRDRVERNRTRGHWGNEIVVFEGVIKRQRDVDRALDAALGAGDVTPSLEQRLDEEGTLYLRLDKQAAVLRELKWCQGSDAIQARFRPDTLGIDDVVAAWRERASRRD